MLDRYLDYISYARPMSQRTERAARRSYLLGISFGGAGVVAAQELKICRHSAQGWLQTITQCKTSFFPSTKNIWAKASGSTEFTMSF